MSACRSGRRRRSSPASAPRISTTRTDLAQTFDEVAELYHRARPGYPDELFDDLVTLTGLAAGARVLEIGCGTGQATRSLLARGFDVTCVEMGPRLADVARRVVPAAHVVTARFEDWRADGTYDAVFTATAWHWLDESVAFVRAAAALRPGGVLAVVDTDHVVPADADPFFFDVQEDYGTMGNARVEPPQPEAFDGRADELVASGCFEPVGVRKYVWTREYDTDAYLDVLATYSGHRAMRDDAREELYARIRRRIAAHGGRIRKHYLNVLTIGRKRA